MNFSGNRSSCDRLETMVPRGVGETWDYGAWWDVIETDAAFICSYTKFIDDGHVA